MASTLLLSLWALSFNISAWAQPAAAYPNKPVKLLVSFPPGGFADLVGRSLAQALTQAWGQPVIIDNRPGGAGILASDVAAKAVPDGYTLYLATDGPFAINPYIYKKLPYDPVESFMPAALVAYTPLALVVNSEQVSSKTLREFVAAARSNPKPLDYSSGGSGGPHHLSMEALKVVAGINLNHIPYKGGATALQAVLASEVNATFSAISTSLPHAKAGKIRILASGGQKRSLLAPEIPTFAESGYPGFEASAWAGVVAPKGNAASHRAQDRSRCLKDCSRSAVYAAPTGCGRGATTRHRRRVQEPDKEGSATLQQADPRPQYRS
ncbi:tripartite tricarboxylate transporter substrate binding protein [Polaromonas sp. P1(28)-8]|nr:tripartite tricarboxylate transporter substrate binding protein [Polaromonas sp. P1(28)-8]